MAFSSLNTPSMQGKKIYFKEKKRISIPEPSDICSRSNNSGFAVVSDKGLVYLLDQNFKLEKKVDGNWMDLEACYQSSDGLLIVDEALRKIILLDLINFEELMSVSIPYSGARNRGFEAIGFSSVSKKY